MKQYPRIIATVILLFGSATQARAQVFNPDNGHYYNFVSSSQSWTQANTAAMGQQFMGQNGYLATITSPSEQSFIVTQFGSLFPSNFGTTPVWLGGFQPDGSPEPAGNFQWVTGEPFVYSNWGPGEPNNFNGIENVIEIRSDGFWNDVSGNVMGSGYVIEFLPEPSTYAIAGLSALALLAARRKRRA